MSPLEATLDQAVRSGRKYHTLLLQTIQVTEDATAAVRIWDTDAATGLIKTRGDLCAAVGRSSDVFAEMLRVAKEQCSGGLPGELQRVISDISSARETLMARQTECEAAMTDGLRNCASELSTLRQRKGLKTAYSAPQHQPGSRMLDSTL